MAILELRGLKVLLPPDLDDGESLWIGLGWRDHDSAVGREAGFWSELSQPGTAEAGCSVGGRWLFGEDSEQYQPGGTRRPSSQIGQYKNKIK